MGVRRGRAKLKGKRQKVKGKNIVNDLEREIAGKFFEGYSVEDLVDEYPFPAEEIESIIRDNSQIKEPTE